MSQQNYPIRPQEEEINLREELDKFLRYWPWFIVGIIVSLILAFAYLKIKTPNYYTLASIIIKDEDKNGAVSEMAAFEDLGLLSGLSSSSIENELAILRSKRMMQNVIQKLNLDVTYNDPEKLKNPELYSSTPYFLNIIKLDADKFKEAIENGENEFYLDFSDGERLSLINEENEKVYDIQVGKPIEIAIGTIVIQKNQEFQLGKEDVLTGILIKIEDQDQVVSTYREKLQIKLVDDNASFIELSLEDPAKLKAQDILDQLILEYNKEALEDKNLVARNTATFIDERLKIINQELDSVETGKEEFKEANQLTDIQAESELFIENASEYKKKERELGTQLELANTMIDYLNGGSNSDLLPANLGIDEEGVNSQIENYNGLVLERNRILSGSTERNPVIIKLNDQISQMRGNVLQSLIRMRDNLKIAQADLQSQNSLIDSQISAVPGKERLYRDIERQQNIKEALYLFLLQKREENSLSLAVTAPKAKVVDAAYSAVEPISPKPKIILLAALIAGLVIPFLIIYFRNLLNNKITDRDDLEGVGEIPTVGEIPRVTSQNEEMVKSNDRGILAEAFRILHTNLQYLIVNAADKNKGNTIFVTSTIKGEGKTLVSFNLAATLANSDKKVLLVGADLRNPQLQRFEKDAREHHGVSDYLANDSFQLKDLVLESNYENENLKILPSGTIPPNPSELWRRKRTEILFAELEEQFDYVIVDTAPSLLVTDTFLINKYADLTLYVVRAGYTEKKLVQFAADAKKDGKLHDVSFVLNDVKWSNFGYGNKYGYAYGEEKKSFLSRLRSKAAIW